MKAVEPVHTVELFPPLSRELLAVLRSLEPADWAQPTTCSAWSAKDVAAHLLGGNLGRLWDQDRLSAPHDNPVLDFDELVRLVNSENELWVQAARRISPGILIEFLALTDRHLYDYFENLDPFEPSRVSVAWADDTLSPNWFDIAREYTEKWLHQQHIRQAVDRPLLTQRAFLYPVLDTFMRGLPHTFRNLEEVEGTSVLVRITGESGGEWSLVRGNSGWLLFAEPDPGASCVVSLDQDLAWRLFTKGITPEYARGQVLIEGDTALGAQVLELVSIIA